jgi:hypothetical protein
VTIPESKHADDNTIQAKSYSSISASNKDAKTFTHYRTSEGQQMPMSQRTGSSKNSLEVNNFNLPRHDFSSKVLDYPAIKSYRSIPDKHKNLAINIEGLNDPSCESQANESFRPETPEPKQISIRGLEIPGLASQPGQISHRSITVSSMVCDSDAASSLILDIPRRLSDTAKDLCHSAQQELAPQSPHRKKTRDKLANKNAEPPLSVDQHLNIDSKSSISEFSKPATSLGQSSAKIAGETGQSFTEPSTLGNEGLHVKTEFSIQETPPNQKHSDGSIGDPHDETSHVSDDMGNVDLLSNEGQELASPVLG